MAQIHLRYLVILTKQESHPIYIFTGDGTFVETQILKFTTRQKLHL